MSNASHKTIHADRRNSLFSRFIASIADERNGMMDRRSVKNRQDLRVENCGQPRKLFEITHAINNNKTMMTTIDRILDDQDWWQSRP